uniref:Uncharacterized protein n=1 Tax=Ditylenchus dipsaci TaxID=166011 RepID=A0A915E817_9BILA
MKQIRSGDRNLRLNYFQTGILCYMFQNDLLFQEGDFENFIKPFTQYMACMNKKNSNLLNIKSFFDWDAYWILKGLLILECMTLQNI